MVKLIALATMATSKRLCEGQDCGIPRIHRVPGSENRGLRCVDCPLDDVDRLADAELQHREV